MATRTLAIIGLGPRGMSVLERIAENARHHRTAGVVVHAIDAHALGSGRVWRREQSRHLLMNTVASQVTLFTDPSVTCQGPITPGPSLFEWARDRALREELALTDPHLAAEAVGIGPDDYPTRALYGAYLEWVYAHVTGNLPDAVRVIPHLARVLAIRTRPDGRYVIEKSDGRHLVVDQAVLALGHLAGALGPRERRLAAFAQQHRLTYLPMANPADVDLSGIEPGQTVLMRGLGLNFFDYLSLLTVGRHGRFERTPGGELRYLPSGAEPLIHAGSRRGVPYHARGHNQKGVTGRHEPRFLTPGTISRLRAEAIARGGLDFQRDIWPLIGQEVEFVYYRALLDPDSRSEDLARLVQDAVALGPEDKHRRLRALGITEDRHWSWAGIETPWREAMPADHTGFTTWLLEYLERDVRNAREGNVRNPLKAAVDAMRDLRNEVRQLVDHGQISAQSYRSHIDGLYTPLNAFVSIGPPARRIEELIALIRAGIVSIAGPNFTAEEQQGDGQGHFRGHSPDVPGSHREARALIEARLPEAGVRTADDPLTAQLVAAGLARHHVLTDDGYRHTTGALDITGVPYRVIDGNGVPHPGLYAFGVPTEGVHWATAAGVRPGVNSVILGDADAIARTLLALAPEQTAAHAFAATGR